MLDRCVECSLYNVQKTDRWKPIKGYEEKYRISHKGEVQYWENNEKEWKTKKIEKKMDIIMLDFLNLGKQNSNMCTG